MTDDPVKQALAELNDIVRCRCHEAYKGRGLQDPQCMCDSADAVKVVADRIEEADFIYSVMHIDLTDAEDRIEELERQLKTVLDREAATYARHDTKMEDIEVRLAKAVEALTEMRKRAMSTRGEQAYREIPAFVVRRCAEIIRVIGKIGGGKTDD